MYDLREVFEMVTKQTEPDLDSWKQQQERQRRRSRNRKLGALALVAALALIVGMFAWTSRRGTEPVVVGSPPVTSIPTLAPDEQDVEIVDLQGNPQALVPGLPEDAYGLSLSSDGTKIAFVTGDGLPDPQIATIGIDGTGLQVLTTGGIGASVPAWSPNGDKIAFEGSVAGAPSDIYVMNADGSGLQRRTDDPAYDQSPQWSPDGSTIAYENSGDQTDENDPQFSPTAEIWAVDVGTGTLTRLTHNKGFDNGSSYSPDGTRIAFFQPDGLWVMDADGRDAQRIVSSGGFTPRWSPDGTQIAYTTYDDRYQPTVPFGGIRKDAPLVIVNVVDVRSGRHHTVGDVGMATDYNTPQWMNNTTSLLIRRVGYA